MIHVLQPFKNIIFDLGGVILNLNEQKTRDEFKKIGIENLEKIFTFYSSNNFFKKFETGKITKKQFRLELRNVIGKKVEDDAIDKAWNAMIVDIPAERIELLTKLRKRYNTYLLSNTNEIHLEYYNAILKNITGHNSLADVMTDVHYSHEIGFRKPEPEAFLYVMKLHDLRADETVFIDDLEPNIRAAAELGIKTLHLTDPNGLLKIFQGMNI